MRIEVRGGGFHHPGNSRQILKDISFSTEGGEILAVLGPNGAGKTTLLRCMLGLLKWDSGKTLIDGTPMEKLPYKSIWKSISYVPQAGHALAAYTVEEMVLLGRTSLLGRFSLPGKRDREKTEETLARLGLSEIAGRPCSELSGGEFQMVLIARALASEPSVLVLDEPESNLDFKNQLLVLNTIERLSQEGITCIFNTHYPAHALRWADRALLLGRDGSVRFGEVREVVTEKNLAEVFGVQSVIGDVETPERQYQDVIPVAIGGKPPAAKDPMERIIAGITVILPIDGDTEAINGILHQYSSLLIGRMGLPYRKAEVSIINLTLDAPRRDILSLTDRLSRVPGVSVKATYAAEVKAHEP